MNLWRLSNVALLVFACLALTVIAMARVTFDRYDHASLVTVVADGRRYDVKPSVEGSWQGWPFARVRLGQIEVHADGTKLVDKSGSMIADAGAISRKIFPYTPEKWDVAETMRSKGGISLGDRVLWIFSWDSLETMSEPSGETFAVELVQGSDGSVKVGRAAELKGLSPHIYFRGIVSYGHLLAMATYGLSLFDTDQWVEKRAMTKGEPLVSGAGRVYWYDPNGTISQYQPAIDKFTTKANFNFGTVVGAYTIGGEDILVFDQGLVNPEVRSSYRFPGGGHPNFYVPVGDVAFGFLSTAFASPDEGILLSPRYLTPLAMIQGTRKLKN